MSIKLMNQVWEMDGLSTSEKLLLLKLADNASDECYCFPSKAKIAKQCGFGKESVRRIIKRLEERGLLERDPRFKDGRQSSNGYLLTLPPPIGDSTPLPSAIVPPPLPVDSTHRTISNESSNNHQQEKGLEKFELPYFILPEVWDDFEKMRKSIKKPLTDRARTTIVNKLRKFGEHSANEILDQSIEHCWQTVYQLKDEDKTEKPESRDLAADYFNS